MSLNTVSFHSSGKFHQNRLEHIADQMRSQDN